jgi:hypothetical protein
VAALALPPLVLVAGAPWLAGYAATQSGTALAASISHAGGGTVAYRDCYSPGSDYLLGRLSCVVSADGRVLASNYVVRYRDTLRARGRWRLYDSAAAAPRTEFRVVHADSAGVTRAELGAPVFADVRFAAFRERR